MAPSFPAQVSSLTTPLNDDKATPMEMSSLCTQEAGALRAITSIRQSSLGIMVCDAPVAFKPEAVPLIRFH